MLTCWKTRVSSSSVLLYVHTDRWDYQRRGAQHGHLTFTRLLTSDTGCQSGQGVKPLARHGSKVGRRSQYSRPLDHGRSMRQCRLRLPRPWIFQPLIGIVDCAALAVNWSPLTLISCMHTPFPTHVHEYQRKALTKLVLVITTRPSHTVGPFWVGLTVHLFHFVLVTCTTCCLLLLTTVIRLLTTVLISKKKLLTHLFVYVQMFFFKKH